MKQIELQLQKRLLIVEVSENELEEFSKRKYYLTFEFKHSIKLICKGSELTEEIAKGFSKCLFDRFYIDYKHDPSKLSYAGEYQFDTALESFISAIESKGYYWGENPFNNYDWEQLEKWNEAESRTFNPEKTLIFEIIT